MAARGPKLAAALALLVGLAGPACAQDAAELVVRLNRLEGQVRQMSGQIEQLQFESRQSKEQLRKFQEDVEFRLQERSGGARPTPQPSAQPSPGATSRPQKRSDAFDPDAEPAAPGAPRALGSAGSAVPPPVGGDAAPRRRAATEDTAASEGPSGEFGGARDTLNPGFAGAGRVAAAPAGGGTKAEYDAAYALHREKQYDQAESAFRRFLASHGRDRLAPDATYWLGDAYLQRGKHREAAEQFLKVSTEYARSPKAPDAMLRLGVSLNALGARDQACATFAEVERKFPNAPGIKAGVDREQKRARCPA